jgi:hypothetical protein
MNYLVRQKIEISVIALINLVAFILFFAKSSTLLTAILALVLGYFSFQSSVLLLAIFRVDDTEDSYGSYLDYIAPIVISSVYILILWGLV